MVQIGKAELCCADWRIKSLINEKAHCFHSALCFLAERKGLEPSASGVTGRRYNRLNYRSGYVVGSTGLEPVAPAV